MCPARSSGVWTSCPPGSLSPNSACTQEDSRPASKSTGGCPFSLVDPEAYVPQEPNSQTPTVLRIRRRKSADMPRGALSAPSRLSNAVLRNNLRHRFAPQRGDKRLARGLNAFKKLKASVFSLEVWRPWQGVSVAAVFCVEAESRYGRHDKHHSQHTSNPKVTVRSVPFGRRIGQAA